MNRLFVGAALIGLLVTQASGVGAQSLSTATISEVTGAFGCLDSAVRHGMQGIGYDKNEPHDRFAGIDVLAGRGLRMKRGKEEYRVTVDPANSLMLVERSVEIHPEVFAVTIALVRAYFPEHVRELARVAPHHDLAGLRSARGFSIGSPFAPVRDGMKAVGAGCQGGYAAARDRKYASEAIIYHGDLKVDSIYFMFDA